ncbi:MAG TPA: CHAP domain-containing protein [Actinocrinis sp.]|nr:CHAP domain-containing protein [Actinocrinis sp.]
MTTVDYLHSQGYTDVRTVGYYADGGHTSQYHTRGNLTTNDAPIANGGDCFVNVRDTEATKHSSDCSKASDLNSPSFSYDDGFVNSPIEYLGCLFAWYVYDVNTTEGTPVDVVAHSMGGLVVRSALAFSSAGNTRGYPAAGLKIRRVITVATPHLGLTGTNAALYNVQQPGEEITEMTTCAQFAGSCAVAAINQAGSTVTATLHTSSLMIALKAAGLPRGGDNAYWALMGSSTQCQAASRALTSCINFNQLGALNTYASGGTTYDLPDTDGVVNTDSQMGMAADFKILYGGFDVNTDPNNITAFTSVPAQGNVYAHEANSCFDIDSSNWTLNIDVPIIGNVGTITIPTEFCLTSPYYLNDGSSATTLAHVCTTETDSCSGGINDLNVLYNAPQSEPASLAEIVALLPPSPANLFTVGHAKHVGNDYPWETIGLFDHQTEGTDPWAEYYGQCDSFAAWKAYENLYGTGAHPLPSIFPAPGWSPPYAGVLNVNQNTWGNAGDWSRTAPQHGWTVDSIAVPGAIAVWNNGHIGPVGHVAYVTDVYSDGSITLENYNLLGNGQYSKFNLPPGGGTVNSFNQSITLPWPDGFAHIGDGAALDANGNPLPPDPKPATPVWGAPQNVKVIGPGSSSSQFSLSNVWYLRTAHGMLGNEQYTHTNGAAAVSTATWTPSGLAANTCYRVDAFVPDNYSDNPTAIYTVRDSTGTSYAAVNENVQTNDWSELGVYKTDSGGGGLSVVVDDRGTTGLYVAADAIRFWRQTNCSAEGDVSPVMAPSSFYGTWTGDSGHGFFGNEKYSATTGTSTAAKNAMWTPAHLLSYGCYDVSLYVPDNYSNNPGASYWSNDAYYGPFYPQVDENGYTNQFAWIGTFQAYSDGTLPVEIFNSGPSGDFVAADAIAFVLNPSCLAQNGGVNAFGSTYSSTIIGPGSSPNQFSTTNDWYYQIGHGYANHELWTHTNGSKAVSTATWTFTGSANACYTASAFIPNNYANNTSAAYTLRTGNGSVNTTINQSTSTGWTPFANNPKVKTGSDGKITVTLNDTGPSTATYTAADAISFVPAGC